MKRRNSALIAGLVAAVCAIFMVGCGEDARFSTETQYLGGVYGPGPVSSSAPQDNVSYWDGDDIDGKPSVKISLGEQRAYFYKSGQAGRHLPAIHRARRIEHSYRPFRDSAKGC